MHRKRSVILRGIDISKWQEEIDWDAMVPHVSFVLMRSAHGDVPVMAVDSRYAHNISEARRLNVKRGTYYFPGTRTPEVEADFYVSVTHRQDGEVQMLDFEGPVLHVPDPVGWAARWLARVYARTGNRPLIYMSESVVHEHDWSRVVAGNYGLVVAKWSDTAPNPGQWKFWALWQDSNHFNVAGVSGQMPDSDIFNGDSQAWAKYGQTGGTPAPVPVPSAPPPPRPAPRTYRVQPGDSLWSIAEHFYRAGAKFVVIAKANHITSPYTIHPGQELLIP